MSFPFTHLCVAYRILQKGSNTDEVKAQFLLGALAPDAVHYRPKFLGAEMKGIGAAKKITHLCPESEEPWGSVTDNEGWIEHVQNHMIDYMEEECGFLIYGRGPLFQQVSPIRMGYFFHVFTDIYNNLTLWQNFRTNHPEEAAKGYTSKYYEDMRNIDIRLFQELPESPHIMELLAKAKAERVPGLITRRELERFQNNMLHEHFQKSDPNPSREYTYVTYDESLAFIDNTIEFLGKVQQPVVSQVLGEG